MGASDVDYARTSAELGFESTLWDAADVLRNNVDPAAYKHVVLGLLFLKYLDAVRGRVAAPGLPGLRVPDEARFARLGGVADERTMNERVSCAMTALERANPSLAGVLPDIRTWPEIDATTASQLIGLIATIDMGDTERRAEDTLGRVYEYFLARFASTEGRGGGEFYTPASVVRLLVEMIEPYHGCVYDPCCGSGGMFVQSLRFLEAHGRAHDAVAIFGQESNRMTWRMARMNLALRGIQADLGATHADTLADDLHRHLEADYILANPPFNVSQWRQAGSTDHDARQDVRWRYGVPPESNANFAWVQHIVHHLAPGGVVGLVLANGSLSSMQSREAAIRRALVEADLVDCIVALPGQLFYSTQIPACVWILHKDRRNRRERILFVDARKLGRMSTRVHRVFDGPDIESCARTYHSFRDQDASYRDVPGLCQVASLAQVASHEFVLTPGRYVVGERAPDDGDAGFVETMAALTQTLRAQWREQAALRATIERHLAGLGLEADGDE